jgi:hypothetical protein
VTKTRFLHVEDSLRIGKLRLFAGTYRRGDGMASHCIHFLDLADARVICHALLQGEPTFTYKEYKGSPPRNGEPAVSRVLSVAVKGDKVYVELTRGPGKVTPTGAITPNGRPETAVNVGFDAHQARRMAATVLAYLRAWDVHRMMVHQDLAGDPAPFSLVPAGRGNGRSAGAATASEARILAADGRGNGRPVTPKGDAPPPTTQTAVATNSNNGHPLRYGDGVAVDEQNQAEVTAFRDYVRQAQTVPPSRAALQAYYREQATT